MHAKRGRPSPFIGPRTAGSYRLICITAIAALGLALSACGGGSGSSTASTSDPSAASAATGGTSTSSDPPTASAASVTLNWTPPTQDVGGTPLTNLAGYEIHYGTASGNYTQTITVDNPGIATYVVDNLSPGTYYFAVGAYNSDGTQSPLSPEVSATVN